MNLVTSLTATIVLTTSATFCRADTAVEGRVELPKTHSAPVANKRYDVVTTGGAISTNPPLGIVYLDVPENNNPSVTKQVAQKNLAFVPALLPVQVGTKVEFPNLDETYHNIFSYSPAKRFDLGRYRPDEKPAPFQVFDKPGLVTLRCDIHEHMRGLILVLESSHFTVTNDHGHFRLTNLPSGRHTLKAWVDSRTTYEKPIELKDGATIHVDFP
jgi:plastocyanin